jgi:hypothetical protein
MTTAVDVRATAALRRAAIRATYAPSVHNTQPWRFDLRRGELELLADRTRQLHVLDPSGRQLMISLGCALFNARVSLAAAEGTPHIERFPADATGEVVARLSLDDAAHAHDAIGSYDPVIEERQTNRRKFVDERVPSEIVSAIVDAAAAENTILHPVRGEDDRLTLARLSQEADRIQILDPAYRAELRAWTSADPQRLDGVSAASVPHVDGRARDEIPMRDFDTAGAGRLPGDTSSSSRQCLLLLGTNGDDKQSWLRAGEGLERVLLEITRRGFAVSPLTQVVEVASVRAALRSELGIPWWPHVLLRVGRAPLAPASRRRRLVEVLHETR